MRGGDEDLRHHILLARCHAGTALAAPALGAIGGEGHAFDVAAMTDGDDHVLALDQVLVLDLTFHFHDLGEPRRSELRLDVGELSLDDVDDAGPRDRKSTRLNSSHVRISYAVFCLKKK